MTVYERKICMLGAAGVGKTSLVRRYVEGLFSERYQTTIGVKVDRKRVTVGGDALNLVLWDVEGETRDRSVRFRYLRGMAGYLLVADGTSRSSLETACEVQAKVADTTESLPFVLLLNKADLLDRWELPDALLEPLVAAGWTILQTSAASGAGVEEGFLNLAGRLLPASR
jgi:hypothetical protein